VIWSSAFAMWGLQLGNNHLLLLACLLLGAVVASLPLSILNLAGLRVRRRSPGPVFAGAPFLIGLEIENGSRFLPASLFTIESRLSPPRGRTRIVSCMVDRVDAGSGRKVTQRGLVRRRGEARLQDMELRSSFPLGLFRVRRLIPDQEVVLVYPRVVPLPVPEPPRLLRRRLEAAIPAPRPLGGEELHGLREFRPGDNPKWIHWRSSARVDGRLLLRELEDPSSRRIRVALLTGRDTCDSLACFEKAVQLAASLLCRLSGRDLVVELELRGEASLVVALGAGSETLEVALKKLALVEPGEARTRSFEEDSRRVPTLVVDPRLMRGKKLQDVRLHWR